MRTHIFIVLTAIFLTACSSGHVSRAQNQADEQQNSQHAQMFDGLGSRFR